jgi:type IV pilus assembly protein PilE
MHKGFTLIELMIVVVVIGILSAIAVPGYNYYIMRSKRAAARTAIQNTAQAEERYFTQNNGYWSFAAGSTISNGWVNYVGNDYNSRTYDLSTAVTPATTTTAASYTISAAPVFTDTLCGTLTLSSTGLQTPTSPSDCWQR